MKNAVIGNRSVWLAEPRPRFPALQADAQYEVAVIGGGITGLTTAYLLTLAGKRVAVFEKGQIGEAETGHTTAHLTYVTDARLNSLINTFGKDGARIAWHGGATAINSIEEIVRREALKCDFQRVPGYLHAALAEETNEVDILENGAQLAAELGFESTFLAHVPLFDRPGIRFANQALFHPLKYLAGLANAIQKQGGAIYEHSEMTAAEDNPLEIIVNERHVRCERIIMATHVPLMGLANLFIATLFQTKLAGYSTYAIGATLPRAALSPACYWDTSDPYYYLRIHQGSDSDYVVFGGEDHKTGQHDDPNVCYERLESLLHKHLPQAAVDHRWSGQVIETHDGLPYIGPVNERQFVATGFSGNGMTYGTLAGMMATDWILGQENPWADLLSANRNKIVAGAWDYLKENMDYPYQLLKGYLKPAEQVSLETVGKGEGRIVKHNGQHCAAYRDQTGELKVCSAICTHMGCVVRWNDAEETWDCPCHGSRFAVDGSVIAGPAETPLAAVEH